MPFVCVTTWFYKHKSILPLMVSAQALALDVIKQSDIVLMILDARAGKETVNSTILSMLEGKKFLYVINKIDLVPESEWQALKKTIKPSIAISSTKHLGTMMLLRKINEIAHGDEVVVGVVGYPNTGKSSLINALRNRASASVSPVAGHTKAIQKIRVSKHIVLLDTPGVLPYQDKRNENRRTVHEYLGTIDVHKLRDPDIVFNNLITEYPGMVEKYFGIEPGGDYEELLEVLCKKKNILRPGNKPDLPRMARQVLIEFQSGKMRPQDPE